MEWIAAKHALLAHLPVAVGLLLPLALIAAQRPGRGIRPWWTACRYLGWAGLLGILASLLSGWAATRTLGLPVRGWLFPWVGGPPNLAQHALWGAAGLPVAVLVLWAVHRKRKEHQGLGILPLFLGLLWAAIAVFTARTGHVMVRPAVFAVSPSAPVPSNLPKPLPADPEARVPLRALDYAALLPIQAGPLKSLAHGGRWIRVWVDEAAAEAYRAGGPLSPGTLVVMSSVEDRWGRPGPDPGPLYALEMKDGKPRLTFYWPRVPLDRQKETGGEARAYWRSPDPRLEACLACHADGLADPGKRSRWKALRRPEAGAAPVPLAARPPSTPPADPKR
jgi:hypothetical protein